LNLSHQVVRLNGVDHFLIHVYERVYLLPLNAESLDFWYWTVPSTGRALELLDIDSQRTLFQTVTDSPRNIVLATTRTPTQKSLAALDMPRSVVGGAHSTLQKNFVDKLKNLVKTTFWTKKSAHSENTKDINQSNETDKAIPIQVLRNDNGDFGLNGLRQDHDVYYTYGQKVHWGL
jgi:hypothetical protein